MAKGRKPGKPPEFNDEQLRLIETSAGLGMGIAEIAALFNRSYRSMYDYIQKNERIQFAIERGKALANQKVAQTAYIMATSGEHPSMTQFWLRTRAKWREVEVETSAGNEALDAEFKAVVESIKKVIDASRDVTPTAPKLLDGKK